MIWNSLHLYLDAVKILLIMEAETDRTKILEVDHNNNFLKITEAEVVEVAQDLEVTTNASQVDYNEFLLYSV